MGYTIPVKGLPNWLVWCEQSHPLERQGEKSPLKKSGGEPMPHSNSHSNSHFHSHSHSDSHSHSHAHSAPRAHQTIFVLFILAIVLTIAAIFTEVFDLGVCEFCGFNDLDDDFELEKSDLNGNAYGLCDVLLSPVFDTVGAAADTSQPVFNLRPTGVGLTGFGDLEYYFLGVISTSTNKWK